MKNTLLLLALSLCAVTAIAQPTLTGATISPVVGDKFYEHDADPTGLSKGASGPAITWNFAGIGAPISDSILYTTCASTPFCDSFPGSAMATYDGSEYFYYASDVNKFAYSGVGEPPAGGDGGCVYYPDVQNIIGYPTAYNSVKVDTYYSFQPTFQYFSHGVDSFIADAYGTLILPSGTYSNVLRVHMINFEADSFYLGSGSWEPDSSRTDYYFWYQPGFHNPLLLMEYDTSGGASLLTNVAYYTTDTVHTAGISKLTNDAQVQVYPNPANDAVHIKLTSLSNQTITVSVTDVTGRIAVPEQQENMGEGMNDITYDVSALQPGMYFIRIQCGGQIVVKKVFIAR